MIIFLLFFTTFTWCSVSNSCFIGFLILAINARFPSVLEKISYRALLSTITYFLYCFKTPTCCAGKVSIFSFLLESSDHNLYSVFHSKTQKETVFTESITYLIWTKFFKNYIGNKLIGYVDQNQPLPTSVDIFDVLFCLDVCKCVQCR